MRESRQSTVASGASLRETPARQGQDRHSGDPEATPPRAATAPGAPVAAPPPLPLTVLVLTKDEERDLPDCMASVAGLAERLVVLDSGSADATVAVARRCTPHVSARPFDGFASQRTAALDLAAHDWVLFLD